MLVAPVFAAKNIFPLATSAIRLHFSSDQELKSAITTLADEASASKIFDEVKNGKVTLQLLNDFNFEDSNSGDLSKVNDDLGRTHGYKITIHKNIAPIGGDKYYLTLSYESELYTNSDQPEAFKADYREILYRNDDGFWQGDIYYKEENILKLMINKVKSKDAYYWKAGAGFHQINADDADRPFLLSGVTQQAWFHRAINNSRGAVYREYNYLAQPNASRSGVEIEAEFGRDMTILEGDHSRTYIRTGVEARLSNIENSSFVGAYISLGHDIHNQDSTLPGIRVVTGYLARKYSDSIYSESFAELSIQGENLGASVRYVVPHTDDPAYLNALPLDFEARDANVPNREPTIWLIVEGKF
tara:strand:- start:4050 stop:5123 length:1074 start_codon:yes stop_codon:yes gene_type:complete